MSSEMLNYPPEFEILCNKYKKVDKCIFSYGTAGFRCSASKLDSVVFRMGILGTLRSKFMKSAIGIMITASHNPECDNGVKIIDPEGNMLDGAWENIATNIANADDGDLRKLIGDILMKTDVNEEGLVFIGRDTRASSVRLSNAAENGVIAIGGNFRDFGLLTTPQLHYIVNYFNSEENLGEGTNEEGYFTKLSDAFCRLNSDKLNEKSNYDPNLRIDCANGVGAPKLTQLLQKKYGISELVDINTFNTGKGILNHNCGADYVKLMQIGPEGMPLGLNVRCASFDGDADRIVYYYFDSEKNTFRLLDGDKIAVLFASYLKEMFNKLELLSEMDFCVVQTAYANGNSTLYINDVLKINTACVPTGVKHLHQRALQSDVSVYFEANGHGTVLFSKKSIKLIKEAGTGKNGEISVNLLNLINLINQTTGDALADFLWVETILRSRNWSVRNWDDVYTDLPNRQLKVQVPDRSLIKTNANETKCLAPSGLNEKLEEAVKKFGNTARSFIRPSGTEDVVRVYAEANSQKEADALANIVKEIVITFTKN